MGFGAASQTDRGAEGLTLFIWALNKSTTAAVAQETIRQDRRQRPRSRREVPTTLLSQQNQAEV